jgi:hypothetical protein
MSNPSTDSAPETAWNRTCPHCGAHVQPVARGCWQCGAELDEPDSKHPDYRPPGIDAEEVRGISISILIFLAIALPVALIIWLVSWLPW